MTKENTKATGNRHMRARIAYLDRASTYLAELRNNQPSAGNASQTSGDDVRLIGSSQTPHPAQGLSLLYSSHLCAIALKAQIRLDRDLKRSICKVCNTRMTAGLPRLETLENLSKDGHKAHADVLILTCHTCDTQKRIPVGAKRQSKKASRPALNACPSAG